MKKFNLQRLQILRFDVKDFKQNSSADNHSQL